MERMESDGFAKRICVGECAGRRSLDRQRKRWIDTVKDCLRTRALNVRETKRGNAWAWPGGMNP